MDMAGGWVDWSMMLGVYNGGFLEWWVGQEKC